jgi:hypothetical protein
LEHKQITEPNSFSLKLQTETSYHAILGRPALAKFMAIPYYPYFLLKMPRPHGILSL